MTALLVPATGEPSLILGDLDNEQIEKHLKVAGGYGGHVTLTLKAEAPDGPKEFGDVHVLLDPEGEINTQARAAMERITSVHMVFHGPVIFAVDQETVDLLMEFL